MARETRESTEENDYIITFSFFLPVDDTRRPSELLELFTENAQMIASIAVQRWLNPPDVVPRAANDAINRLKELPAVLSEKRRQKHQMCAVCQEDFLKPSEKGEKDRNQENITRMPCHHLYHKSCLRSWLETTCNCPHCRYEISSDNPAYNQGMKERMKARDLQLQQEQDTDDEDDPPAANTRSKTRRKRMEAGEPSGEGSKRSRLE